MLSFRAQYVAVYLQSVPILPILIIEQAIFFVFFAKEQTGQSFSISTVA